MAIVMMRLPATLAARGRGRSAHYLDIRRGLCTSGVKIGARSTAWPAHEVEAINAARLRGFSDDEVRSLVAELEAARREAA